MNAPSIRLGQEIDARVDAGARVGHRRVVEATARTRDARRLALVFVLATAVPGCVHRVRPPVARVVDGSVQEGAFVSPYEYEWFTRGEIAAAEGRRDEARLALEKALLGAGEDPYVLSRLAELRAERDEAAAARLLARAEELDPRSEAAALARGRIAEAHGRMPEALSSYREALDRAPASPASLEAVSRVLVASGADGDAAAILAAHPTDSLPLARLRFEIACRRGDEPAMETAAAHLATTYAPGEVDVRRAIAAAVASNDASRAARLLGALPEPTNDDRVARVLSLARAGDVAQAEVELAAGGVGDDPVDVARLTLALGKPEEALASLEAVLTTRHDPRATRLRGEALFALGRLDDGAAALRSVPRGTTERPLALASLAEHLRAAGRAREADEAAAELSQSE